MSSTIRINFPLQNGSSKLCWKLCSKLCYLIISKNFNQISNLLLLKKFLIYLLLKTMLLEATSNLNYHILIQVDSEEQLIQFFPSQKSFSVPCIFTCFKYLVSPAKDVKGNGELFDKLKLALTFSAQPVAANLDLLDFTAIKKRLHNLLLSATSNKQTLPNQNVCKKSPAIGGQKRIDNTVTPAASLTSNKSARVSTSVSKKHTESRHVQTDEMNTETLKRFESLINGPHSAALCKIMDILTSGYGKLDVDTDVLFVKFIVEEKVKF